MTKPFHPAWQRSEEMLLETFEKLLSEKTYAQITVTEIADAAQLGRKTFYRHYPSKDAILQDYLANLKDGYFQSLALIDEFTYYSFAHLTFSYWRERISILTQLEESGLFRSFLDSINETITGQNLFPCSLGGSPEMELYCGAYVSGGCKQLVYQWVRNGAKESPETMAKLFTWLQHGGH